MSTIAYCGGTFDLLHPGHTRFFRWAKSNFDVVIAALNTDRFAGRYKARPTQSASERWEMLESCRWIDKVISNYGDENSKPAILESGATHIINGSDWDRTRLMQQMGLTEEFLLDNGLSIVLCPLRRQFSTTELKERIRGKH